MLTRFVALIAILVVGASLQIIVMIKGWGLQAESWWWIIGIGIFVSLFYHFIAAKVVSEFHEGYKEKKE